jgi:hypothetical protein
MKLQLGDRVRSSTGIEGVVVETERPDFLGRKRVTIQADDGQRWWIAVDGVEHVSGPTKN